MFQSLRNIISPARVALAIGLLTAAAAFIATLATNLAPGSSVAESLGKAGVLIAALIKAATLLNKFLDGSQNWDSLIQAGVPKAPGVTVVNEHDLPAGARAVIAGSSARGITYANMGAGVPVSSLGGHPDNDQSAEYVDHEITEEDTLSRFGTTAPLPEDEAAQAMRGFTEIEDSVTDPDDLDKPEEGDDLVDDDQELEPPDVDDGRDLESRVQPDNPDQS